MNRGYKEATELRDGLDAESKRTSQILKEASGDCGAMGLASDAVRATPEWKAAARDFARAFRALQGFNRSYVRQFKREIQQERSKQFGQVALWAGGIVSNLQVNPDGTTHWFYVANGHHCAHVGYHVPLNGWEKPYLLRIKGTPTEVGEPICGLPYHQVLEAITAKIEETS